MSKREKLENCIWHGLPIAAFVLWGVLCLTDHLWYDEAYSAGLVNLSWKRMITITAVDAHSPFYYSLLKIFYVLLGGGTRFAVLKWFSLLFMTGYMLLGKYYVKKLFGKKVSLYFMLFSLLMPIMSIQAGNVRMYATALFFMTLMGLSAYDIYEEATRTKWVIFCLSAVGTVYCHTFAMIQAFWFFVLFFVALLRSGQKEKLKGFFLSGFSVALLFSPWLFVTARQMALRMKYDTGSATERATLGSFADYTKEWFSALETPITAVVILGLLLFGLLAIFGCIALKEKKDKRPVLGFLALLFTIATGFLVSVFVNNCFLGRYVFPGFGFLMLFYAMGMERIKKLPVRLGLVAVALVAFVLQYSSEVALEYDGGLEQYKSFVEREVAEEDVMIGPFAHTVFLSVYHPKMHYYIDSYKPYKLPFDTVEELTEHSMLSQVSGKIRYICFEGSEPESFKEEYDYHPVESIHYMYYDFVIYELAKK